MQASRTVTSTIAAAAAVLGLGAVLSACAPADDGEVSTPDISAGPSAGTPDTSHAASPIGSPRPREFTVNVSGDLLWHDDLWASAAIDAAASGHTGHGAMDFGPQLASVKDYISTADLAICHSEVPFAEEGGPYGAYPTFAAPPQIAQTLAETGFDVCTTASNHTLDAGWNGLVRTLNAHEEAGIGTVGSYRTQAEADAPYLRTVETEAGPVCVGIVSRPSA